MAHDMNKLLDVALQQDASDIHLTVGRPPSFRISGEIKSLNTAPLTPEDTASLMKQVTSERGQRELAELGSTDFAIGFFDKARFRVNVFKQRGHNAMVLRKIHLRSCRFEDLNLPPHLKDIISRPRGIILVTGPTGSGKSTTLAAFIDFLNANFSHHILTIEDPVEFVHPHKKSIVNQREVHNDLPDFSEGLRRALREDPDVILVGEMRDLETISSAISAAETGHLVFGTLHTTGAARTIDRIIDAFPTSQQEMVRTQLAGNIVSVISQTLLKRASGKGRVAAYEIMIRNNAIANLIRENKTFRIDSAIQTSGKEGMILLDDYLFKLYGQGMISFEDMMLKCKDQAYLTRKVQEAGGAVE